MISLAKNRATDRRAWIRMPKDQQVTCQPMADPGTEEPQTGWMGTVRDISAGGITVILNRHFEPETSLIVDLSPASKAPSQPRPARVIHATAQGKGYWIIGCAFASPLSQKELLNILRQ
jgi:PilZ domain